MKKSHSLIFIYYIPVNDFTPNGGGEIKIKTIDPI